MARFYAFYEKIILLDSLPAFERTKIVNLGEK